MKNIYLYFTPQAWNSETPDATIVGNVYTKNGNLIEINDENGFTQLINMDKLFAIVY